MALGLFTGLTADTAPTARLADVYSVNFQGDDEYMTTTADGTLADKTYTFWAKSDATSATERNCVFAHGATNKGAFFFNWSGSHPLLYLGTSYYRFWNDSSSQDDDAWHFYAVVVDVSNVSGSSLYIDGILQSVHDTATTSANVQAYGSLRIAQAGTEDFDGNIDEFCVFDGHLSAASVVALWNGGEPSDPNRVAQPGQLEHWWRMGDDGGSGPFIPDHANLGVGAEELTNGGFDADSDWAKNTGWSIEDGTARCSGAQSGNSDFYQESVLDVANTVYEVTFTVSNYSAGNTRCVVGGSGVGTYRSANGTYTEQIQVVNGPHFYLQADVNFVGYIDNVSVKAVNGKPGYLYNGAVIQTDAP